MDILLITTMQQSENTVSVRFFLFWIVSDGFVFIQLRGSIDVTNNIFFF